MVANYQLIPLMNMATSAGTDVFTSSAYCSSAAWNLQSLVKAAAQECFHLKYNRRRLCDDAAAQHCARRSNTIVTVNV
jgi:hypothetical protein